MKLTGEQKSDLFQDLTQIRDLVHDALAEVEDSPEYVFETVEEIAQRLKRVQEKMEDING